MFEITIRETFGRKDFFFQTWSDATGVGAAVGWALTAKSSNSANSILHDNYMARIKVKVNRKSLEMLRKHGIRIQTAFMQTRPKRADGRPHGVMPRKRRGHGWTTRRAAKK
jgi:hypothetical protein